MNQNLKEKLFSELQLQQSKSKDYKAWGEVEVLEAAIRLGDNEMALFKAGNSLNDIIVLPISSDNIYAKLFKKKKNIGAILLSKQTNAQKVIHQKPKEVPPILDDQAQLLGVSIRVVEPAKFLKGISGRYSVLLTDGTTICIGNNLEDAFIAAFLVEKTCKAYVESQSIGGSKSINRIEAWLMHKFYLLKYSKESEKNK